jgi:hypothetical protein
LYDEREEDDREHHRDEQAAVMKIFRQTEYERHSERAAQAA